MMRHVHDIAAVVGPTAAGKSAIAEAAADRFGAAIVSVDSMQVYRGMDIGTAKPSRATRSRLDYEMIDVCDPRDDLSVQAFQTLGRRHLDGFLDANRRVIVVGGSGLHFRAIVDPMTFAPTDPVVRGRIDAFGDADARSRLIEVDPDAARNVDMANRRRVIRALEIYELTGETPTSRAATPEHAAVRAYEAHFPFHAVGIDAGDRSRALVRSRLARMLELGLLAEVDTLRESLGAAASQAVGYKEFLPVLDGSRSLSEGTTRAENATHALVKRQRTFFRRDPRIVWLPWEAGDNVRITRAVDMIGEMMQWTS